LDSKEDADLVWVVSSDDVLEMLEAKGVTPELLSLKLESIGGSNVVWLATSGVFMVPDAKNCHETPLIALMELLKSLEGENE
jgi:hypothetical protein